jgi:transcription elongation regulator 1
MACRPGENSDEQNGAGAGSTASASSSGHATGDKRGRDTDSDDESGRDDEATPAKKAKQDGGVQQQQHATQQQQQQRQQGEDKPKTIDLGKQAAIEAEVRAAREREQVPLETRMHQFREMLVEKEVSAFSTWEKELHKIVFDPRYLLLTSKERKAVFEKYVKERAEDERREKKQKMKQKRDEFRQLLEEAGLTAK